MNVPLTESKPPTPFTFVHVPLVTPAGNKAFNDKFSLMSLLVCTLGRVITSVVWVTVTTCINVELFPQASVTNHVLVMV